MPKMGKEDTKTMSVDVVPVSFVIFEQIRSLSSNYLAYFKHAADF